MRHTPECFANHMGFYMCEPVWMRQAVTHIKAGRLPSRREAADLAEPFELTADGIAIIAINGPMIKGESKFSQANTMALRSAVRSAASSEAVRGIMLVIDSPGGTVAGTGDLAAEVQAAGARKPVHAFIEDLGASAAFWVASQASRITATPTAEVGSIGTVAVVEDTSGKAEMDGIVVHVISTGPYKGAFADGAPVEPEHLADLQARVDALNSHFLEAVSRGRRLGGEALAAVADGRIHIAGKAQRLGLVDAVGTFEDAAAALRQEIETRSPRASRNRRASALIALAELGG